MSGGDGGASETDDPTLKKVESVKVKVSEYEHVCYSYGHGIQCKQRKECVSGWMDVDCRKCVQIGDDFGDAVDDVVSDADGEE